MKHNKKESKEKINGKNAMLLTALLLTGVTAGNTMPKPEVLGDINGDRKVTAADYEILTDSVAYMKSGGVFSPEEISKRDINKDGALDAFDIADLGQLLSQQDV